MLATYFDLELTVNHSIGVRIRPIETDWVLDFHFSIIPTCLVIVGIIDVPCRPCKREKLGVEDDEADLADHGLTSVLRYANLWRFNLSLDTKPKRRSLPVPLPKNRLAKPTSPRDLVFCC